MAARVLVIDDEANICFVINEFLSSEGFEVITAQNGKDGLEVLEKIPLPDLIIMDLLMPGLSGKEVALRLRSDPCTKGIPILIMTASLPNNELLPPDSFYDALILKPYSLEDLLAAVLKLLSESGGQSLPHNLTDEIHN